VYYVGLLAGENDMDLLERSKVGRDINRHYYSREEVMSDLGKPVVQRLLDLIRLRNRHPAFQGQFTRSAASEHQLTLQWTAQDHYARLEVDLVNKTGAVHHSAEGGDQLFVLG
jgi:sucrose phosphorylase